MAAAASGHRELATRGSPADERATSHRVAVGSERAHPLGSIRRPQTADRRRDALPLERARGRPQLTRLSHWTDRALVVPARRVILLCTRSGAARGVLPVAQRSTRALRHRSGRACVPLQRGGPSHGGWAGTVGLTALREPFVTAQPPKRSALEVIPRDETRPERPPPKASLERSCYEARPTVPARCPLIAQSVPTRRSRSTAPPTMLNRRASSNDPVSWFNARRMLAAARPGTAPSGCARTARPPRAGRSRRSSRPRPRRRGRGR